MTDPDWWNDTMKEMDETPAKRWGSPESFLGYCEGHSRTDRALFHRDDIRILLQLAGKPVEEYEAYLAQKDFWAIFQKEMDPLLAEARKRLAEDIEMEDWLESEAERS